MYFRLTLPIACPSDLFTALRRLIYLYPYQGGLRGYLPLTTITSLLPLLDTLLTPYRMPSPSGTLYTLPNTAVTILVTLSSYLHAANPQLDHPLTPFFLRHLTMVSITHLRDFTGSHLITHILRVAVSLTDQAKAKVKVEGEGKESMFRKRLEVIEQIAISLREIGDVWTVIAPKMPGGKCMKVVKIWKEWVRRDVEGSKEFIGESEYQALKLYLKPMIN